MFQFPINHLEIVFLPPNLSVNWQLVPILPNFLYLLYQQCNTPMRLVV